MLVPPRGDAPPLEAGRGRGKALLWQAGIRDAPDAPDHPSEQAGCRGAGSGRASRSGRAGRAGRASFLVAGCVCVPLRRSGARGSASRFVQRGRRLAEVRLHLSSFGFWGEGLQALQGC